MENIISGFNLFNNLMSGIIEYITLFFDKLITETFFGIIFEYSPTLSNKISSTLMLLSITEAIFNATRCAPPARKSGNIIVNFFSKLFWLNIFNSFC